MLEARGLEKHYGEVAALRGVDLEAAAGEVIALLGRNGAGKTTMLSIVAGLLAPDAGRVTVDEIDVIAHPEAAATRIGIAPQETGIYRVLTVRENLEFFAEIAGLRRAARRQRAVDVSERLGLAHLLDRRATTLSGGEARRLHTACALVHTPPLLLLDEPTVGADVATRNQVLESVRDVAAEGAAVVYTTHYLPEVEVLEAQIVVIDDGRRLARGTRAELVASHFEPGLDVCMAGNLDLREVAELADLQVRALGDRTWRVTGAPDLPDLTARLGHHAADLIAIEATQPDLEQVFLEITGRRLDDEAAE